MKPGTRTLLAACTSLVLGACGEDPTAPPGTIQVTVMTTGGDQDADGYELFVGTEKRVIPATNTVRVDGFTAGSHVIELRGVANNCSVVGDNPRSVAVESGAVTSVIVEVACDPTGVVLEFRTVGPDAPILGYTVRTAGRALVARPNESLTISGLTPGSHEVTLTIPGNCTVPGGSSFAVTVAHRAMTRVTVEITCDGNPNLIAFVLDTVINRAFSRWIAVTGMTEGALHTTLFQGFDPAWSRDGKKMAYSTTYCDYYYGYGCTGGLSIIDHSSGAHSAPENLKNGVQPSWSPDGRLIAFIEFDANYSGVLKVAATEGSGAVLPLNLVDARSPSWSPDGKRIAFQCQVNNVPARAELCLVNNDGSGFVRLTTDTVHQTSPAWSPDGSTLAFVNTLPGGLRIMLMKPDGTDVRELVPGWQPSWSPDGSKVVFARSDGLFVVGSDGSSVTRISTGSHYAPNWRP